MQPLVRHPSTPSQAVTGIEAQAVREGGLLKLRYVLRGSVEALRLPEPASPARTDALWRRTCFEAFVRPQGQDGYYEFNLAPSTQWAAYAFDSYRAGMRPAPITPQVEVRRTGERVELAATLTLAPAQGWRVGLAAVVEEADGRLSYWALRHPPGKPDFHNADCFALELPESRGA